MTPLEHRGRTQFVLIIALGTLALLASGLRSGPPTDPRQALALYARPLALVLLGVLAAHGRRWAHKALIGFYLLFVFLVALLPIAVTRPRGTALTILLVLGAVYAACALLLLRSTAIRAFLQRPIASAGPHATPPSGA